MMRNHATKKQDNIVHTTILPVISIKYCHTSKHCTVHAVYTLHCIGEGTSSIITDKTFRTHWVVFRLELLKVVCTARPMESRDTAVFVGNFRSIFDTRHCSIRSN